MTTSFCAIENAARPGSCRCTTQCESCSTWTLEVPAIASVASVASDGARDPEFEREFLAGAEKLAGLNTGYAERVSDRLLRSERLYGVDSYRKLSFTRIITEISEEALDLGGWPVLAVLLTQVGLDDETRLEARLILQEVAAYGARADALVSSLRGLLTP